MTLNTKRSKVPHTNITIPPSPSPKFQCVSLYAPPRVSILYGQPFSIYRPFWDKCSKWPQNDLWTLKVKGTSYIYYNQPQVPNFTPFTCTASRFRVTAPFETSAPKDPKMNLNTKRLKVPIVQVTTTTESLTPFRFPPRPAIFEFQDSLTQAHWMTPRMALNTKRTKYHILYML